ncbi:type VI secretion system baseplate subunit TssG [Psychromonas ossibalaenae]|uniref:type VI secretion system baseplate subunit TssG n=1 Tax=Psychromonas ossibalaenae TaxID=444922 RepID=UPI00036C6991|nr:type VI secretion system baseplate subunit TssG [Psychromonas ossibalaenae]
MQKYALNQLVNDPSSFELHCAVQLVKHDATSLGQRPEISFSANLLPAYQQADITEVEHPSAGKWKFTCDMPALSGSQGVMPRYNYSESLKELFEQGNYALVDFFNGFNSRYYRLHCQSELKNNLSAQAEEEHFSWKSQDQSLTTMLANLYGGLGNNHSLPSAHLIQYSGLLGLKLSCPNALQELLADYFEYDFEVQYGDVDYLPLLPCSLTKLGKNGQNNQLGFDALVGKSAVTAFQRLDVMVKPNNYRQFNQIRNDKQLFNALDSLIRHYMGVDIKLKLKIKVAGKYLPGLQLTTNSETSIRLAQSTWLAPRQISSEYVVMPLKK